MGQGPHCDFFPTKAWCGVIDFPSTVFRERASLLRGPRFSLPFVLGGRGDAGGPGLPSTSWEGEQAGMLFLHSSVC